MSDDGTREVLNRFVASSVVGSPVISSPIVRVIDNPGRIVSTGLNAALKSARGEIIIRMDAHTEYAPDYVSQCVAAIQATGADNVGGPWVARGNDYLSQTIAAAFQSPFAVGGASAHKPCYEGPIDTVYLGCWRRQAFGRFGCFDEELVRNQDDEHNLRIVRGGGKIWQSQKIRSWYRPRGSLGALFNQYVQYGYWKVRVIQKHKLPASWRHLVPGAFVFTLAVLALLSVFCFLLLVAPNLGAGGSVFNSYASFCFLLSDLCFFSLVGVYVLCVFGASLLTAAKTEWKLLPVLPAVFPCYHFGYGYGFLRGIWDFMIRGRRPATVFTTLTRG